MNTAATSPTASPLDIEDLRARVQKSLEAFLGRQARVLEEVGDELAPLMEATTDLLAGGKRLRAAFCYWGWRGAGGADGPQITTAAAALELFQAAALIHDDVMDGSDTRRGRPAAHRRFASLHRGSGWLGDEDAFGVAGAVLLGDLCLCWSDEMLTGSGLDPDCLARGRATFDRMRTELMAGQYLDMLEQAVGGGSVHRAQRVIRHKSARYSVEQPLLLGGQLAGAAPALLAAYSAYGLPLGEAFQLRDDILGVFGDPSQTGKPAGDDLREGKRTVLVALALERATPAQVATVRRHLGDPHLGAEGVAELREVLVATGARQAVEDMIVELSARARGALEPAALTDPARAVLTELVTAATARQD